MNPLEGLTDPCPRCTNDVSVEVAFCPYCNYNLMQAVKEPAVKEATPTKPRKAKKTPDPMVQRIVAQIMEFCYGKHEDVLKWMESLGCKVTNNGDGTWVVIGLTGITCGLPKLSPIDLAPQFGFILAGMYWPWAFPGLLEQADKAYKAKRKSEETTDGV